MRTRLLGVHTWALVFFSRAEDDLPVQKIVQPSSSGLLAPTHCQCGNGSRITPATLQLLEPHRAVTVHRTRPRLSRPFVRSDVFTIVCVEPFLPYLSTTINRGAIFSSQFRMLLSMNLFRGTSVQDMRMIVCIHFLSLDVRTLSHFLFIACSSKTLSIGAPSQQEIEPRHHSATPAGDEPLRRSRDS